MNVPITGSKQPKIDMMIGLKYRIRKFMSAWPTKPGTIPSQRAYGRISKSNQPKISAALWMSTAQDKKYVINHAKK